MNFYLKVKKDVQRCKQQVFLIFNRSPSSVQAGKLLLIKEVLLGSSQIIE